MIPKFQPIIPKRRPDIFEHPDWLYELKYDGFRALAYLDQGLCRFVSKKGNELKRFDSLCSALAKQINVQSAVLDGEVVALDENGKPAFYHLMKRNHQAVYFAFDLLWLNGEDLRDLSLLERKKILRSLIPRKSLWVGYVGYIERDAEKLFELVKSNDLEGLIVKRKDGKYNPHATRWFKVLNPRYSQKVGRHEFFQRN